MGENERSLGQGAGLLGVWMDAGQRRLRGGLFAQDGWLCALSHSILKT